MDALRNFIGQIGMRRALAMGGVALALLAGLGWMALRTPASEMGYLYTDLDPAAASTITEKLKAQGVPFQLSADGSAIMAPADKLPELRMSMASEQLGGKIGYEVLDEEEPFGISSSRAKLNETRAIEGELVRSIESLDRVTRARVHVVMPERAMFETEPRKATASVTVKTNGRLPAEAVQAIRYLVASAVPDLSPEAVSIVDQTGALLARAGEEGEAGAGDLEGRQAAVEARLRDQIETMIEPIVGHGKVRAEVSAVLERDQVREESDTYDPDAQVIAHQVTVESNNQSNENDAGGQGASVAAQLPDAQATQGPNGSGDSRRSAQNETSEDVTYQNSHTQKVAVRTPGQVKRLTVAVMVDGGAKGLAPAQVQRIQRLVENAVGYDAQRGDSVVVENMSFAAPSDLDGLEGGLPFGLTVDRILDVLKIVLIGGIVLFALRMLRGSNAPALLPAPTDPSGEGEDMEGAAMLDRRGDLSPAQLENLTTEPELLDQEVALANVDGRVKLSVLRRIGEAITANPAESASVIRQWMNT